jgi:phospholipase/carboxylesterase
MDQTKEQVLIKSLVAEIKLNKLIDEVMQKNELKGEQISIGGFSQGCMISLQTGIKRKEKINSIVGYSGKIINTSHLENNIISRPNIILMHGDKDQIVPPSFLFEAKDFYSTAYLNSKKIFEEDIFYILNILYYHHCI